MTIPEAQLSTWSNLGATIGSETTFQQIKATLESKDSPYFWKKFEVYLQGSYGNRTNIYSESDVDVVIELQSSYIFDVDLLPPREQLELQLAHNTPITYGLDQFKQQVITHLKTQYGTDVVIGKRAINIKARGNRRSADVIVCISYKRFTEYKPYGARSLDGILFYDSSGNQIINYPKYHAENCTNKDLATNNYFKPTVRIFKNMRCHLVDTGILSEGDAPSYFLEGMVWNIPYTNFGYNYEDTVFKCLDWLSKCIADDLLCANRMYPLLNPVLLVTWRKEKFVKFLSASINLWNKW